MPQPRGIASNAKPTDLPIFDSSGKQHFCLFVLVAASERRHTRDHPTHHRSYRECNGFNSHQPQHQWIGGCGIYANQFSVVSQTGKDEGAAYSGAR